MRADRRPSASSTSRRLDPRALVANHQVVIHGYELDAAAGHVSLSVYDPNHPDDDTIRLGIAIAGPRGPVALSYLDREAPVLGLVPLRSSARPAPGP